jgi:hypothetical protein
MSTSEVLSRHISKFTKSPQVIGRGRMRLPCFFVWFEDTKIEIRLLTCGVHLSVSLFSSLYSSPPIFVPYAREVGCAVSLGGAGSEDRRHSTWRRTNLASHPLLLPYVACVSPRTPYPKWDGQIRWNLGMRLPRMLKVYYHETWICP